MLTSRNSSLDDYAGNGEDHAAAASAAISEGRTLDIEIDPPIVFNDRTYTTLHLEEPTGQMVLNAEAELAGGMNMHSMRRYQFALVSHGGKIPRQAVDKMRISQIREAADFLSQFIGGVVPQTGEN